MQSALLAGSNVSMIELVKERLLVIDKKIMEEEREKIPIIHEIIVFQTPAGYNISKRHE